MTLSIIDIKYGELTERLMVPVLKTGGRKRPVGSNPTFAARPACPKEGRSRSCASPSQWKYWGWTLMWQIRRNGKAACPKKQAVSNDLWVRGPHLPPGWETAFAQPPHIKLVDAPSVFSRTDSKPIEPESVSRKG